MLFDMLTSPSATMPPLLLPVTVDPCSVSSPRVQIAPVEFGLYGSDLPKTVLSVKVRLPTLAIVSPIPSTVLLLENSERWTVATPLIAIAPPAVRLPDPLLTNSLPSITNELPLRRLTP